MGIYGAMLTAVTGLSAQSYALENISGNIANSQTPGFKRLETSFQDLILDAPVQRQDAGSVAAYSRATNTLIGDMTDTGVRSHIALSGQGFFVVRDRTSYSGGTPVFGGQEFYTRRGDFEPDADGYLVNKAGNYLMGVSVDPFTGTVNGTAAAPIRISTTQVPPKATSAIRFVGSLPAMPKTTNYTSNNPPVANSELLDTVYNVTTNPDGYQSLTTIQANEDSKFQKETIAGPNVTVYDSLGTPVTLQTRWAKTNSVANGGTDTWSLYFQSNPTATGATAMWTNVGTNFTFNSSGTLTSGTTANIPLTPIGGVNIGPISLDFSGGLTQYADISGYVKQSYLSQDGYTAGKLSDIDVNSDGIVTLSYSNGLVRPAFEVSVAQFNAPNALRRLDGGTFAQTSESGAPLLGLNGTKIQSGKLEGSNSDIADEFSKMIVTQQAYSANTKVITTSQQMLQDVLSIIR